MKLTQVAIAFDQLVNTLLGGYADETMSSRCWRLRDQRPYKFMRWLIDTILWFDKDHCYESYMSEVNRKYLPSEFRNKD